MSHQATFASKSEYFASKEKKKEKGEVGVHVEQQQRISPVFEIHVDDFQDQPDADEDEDITDPELDSDIAASMKEDVASSTEIPII